MRRILAWFRRLTSGKDRAAFIHCYCASKSKLFILTNQIIDGVTLFQKGGYFESRLDLADWYEWSLDNLRPVISEMQSALSRKRAKRLGRVWDEYVNRFHPESQRLQDWPHHELDPFNEWDWSYFYKVLGEKPLARGSDLLIGYMRRFQELS